MKNKLFIIVSLLIISTFTLSATSVTPIYAFNMNDYKESKKEKYFNKGELFGLPDSYIVEPYEEYRTRYWKFCYIL